ncbi:hypothetical protein P389DRAFT_211846 [Cystobasidium minutum MCA 4210]|uniref:uncharacterized protein n=1 Tax=Cystobasidium minutum MCA 4210 TaxID=1397322 RepID=UPI0034CEE8CC|eukprot:jgi/Rhomi1/211846/estExt_Genemark1.C_5_t10414
MPRSIDSLPDEVLRIVVRQLTLHPLRRASVLSKRWYELCKPELFSKIDLARRSDVTDLQAFHDALFVAHDGRQAPLVGSHVTKLCYNFTEDFLDLEELAAKRKVSSEMIRSLKGISVLKLELSLVTEANPVFDDALFPAIKSFLDVVRNKVDSIDLHLVAFGGMDFALEDDEDGFEADEGHGSNANDDAISMKLAAISKALPVNKLRRLRLDGIECKTLPPSFIRLFTSPALVDIEISVEESGKAFMSLPPVPNLSKLAVNWGEADTSSVQIAERLCKNSANSLKTLKLRSMLPEGLAFPLTVSPRRMPLPQLSHLHIAADGLDFDFLLDRVLSYNQVPRLTKLTLEMDDIIQFKVDLAGHISHVQSLRKIVLIEESSRKDMTTTAAQANFKSLINMCTSRGIGIDCVISPFTCQTPADLAIVFERLDILSTMLVDVSLNVKTDALFEVHELRTVVLPRLEELLVSITNARTVGEYARGSDRSSKPTIGDLFRHLQAPNLKHLQTTIMATDEFSRKNFESLEQSIEHGMYSKLDRVVGTIMSSARVPLEDRLETFTHVCDKKGIDCSGMEIIDNGAMMGGLLREDDDESIASDDLESEDAEDHQNTPSSPGHDAAGSESGESGYGEDVSSLRHNHRSDKDIDDGASDSVVSSRSMDSTDTDDSWMTDPWCNGLA